MAKLQEGGNCFDFARQTHPTADVEHTFERHLTSEEHIANVCANPNERQSKQVYKQISRLQKKSKTTQQNQNEQKTNKRRHKKNSVKDV